MENEKCKCIEELTTLEEVKIIEHGTNDYSELNNKPQINNHELVAGNNTLDDIGAQPKGDYATKSDISEFIKKDVDNLDNYYDKTTIDSKTEDFITKAVDDLTNYYKKSETYTQEEINQRISAIKTGGFKNVDQLPETGEENYIYLVPAEKTFNDNIKDEFIWLTDIQKFERIGSTQLDLDGYVTTEQLTQKLQEYVTSTFLEEKLQEYAKTSQIPDTSEFITDAEVDVKLLNKADKSEIPSLDNYYTKEETYSNTEIDEKIKEASGTDLSAYLKKEEASETYETKTNHKADLDKKVDAVIQSEKGTAGVFNSETGGQLLFLTNDDKIANVSVNDGEANIYVQLSSTDKNTKEGARVTLDSSKAYYTSGNTYEFSPEDEIVTKKSLPDTSQFITSDGVDTKLQDYVTNQALEEKHYLTEHQDISNLATKTELNLKADKSSLDNYAKSTDIADFIKKDVAELDNFYDKAIIDSKTENFITKAVNDLTNYYLKTETYSQTEIDQKINTVISGGFKKVEQLPEQGESKYIYLVPAEKSFSQNIKNEFIWLDDEQAFEQIGSTQLDLEPYVTTEALNQKLQEYVAKTELENYYKKTETYSNTEVDDKVDEETRDLLKTLSRELKPDEEDESGYSAQTLVNVKNKSDATELIVEIDNLDVKTNVAVNSVLGTLKGQDLEDRLKVVEGAGYVTKDVSDLTNYYDQTTIDSKLDGKQPTGDYALKTDIPTTTSKLTNDSGFITNEVDDLANYDTATQVNSKITTALTSYAKTSELPKVGTLSTVDEDILQTSSSESLSGTIKLHKIAKTGSWADLNNKPNLPSKFTDLQNDWLMPGTDEANALSLSTQNPNKFFYTVEE